MILEDIFSRPAVWNIFKAFKTIRMLIPIEDGATRQHLIGNVQLPVLEMGKNRKLIFSGPFRAFRLRKLKVGKMVFLTSTAFFVQPDDITYVPHRCPENIAVVVKGADLAAFTHLIMVKIAALLPPRYWGVYADSPALAALLAGEDPWPACETAVPTSSP